MPKVSPLITNFSSGEISTRLDGRIDISKYANACTTLENAIIYPQGGATRRAGTVYVSEVKDSTKQVRLVNFEFSTTQAYMLEFGDQYIRFYKDQGQITDVTGSDLITNGTFASNITGWTDKSVGSGSIAHDTDHMNLVSTNSSNYGWAEQSITTVDDSRYQINFTVTGGSLNLLVGTATGGSDVLTSTSYAAGSHAVIFTADSTTTYIGFNHQAGATVQLDTVIVKKNIPYEIATPYLEADLFEISYAQSADTLYLAHRSYSPRKLKRSGHTSWTLTNINFTGSTFPSTFAGGTAGTGTDGNDKNPGSVTFFEQRLMWAGTNSNPQTIYGSKTGDYENMDQGSSAAADSVEYTLASNQVNVIQWLVAAKSLLIGTLSGEFKMDGGGAALTPANVRVVPESHYGSKKLEPVQIENVLLFLQRAGRKLREFVYDYDQDNYIARDLTVLAEHLTTGGFVDTTYQQEEDSIVWAVRGDGVLCAMTYLRGDQVIAWHRHTTQGTFESVSCIPHSTANRDEVWVAVKRTINGATKRFVEYMDPAVNVDCGLTYSGVAKSTFPGLRHLVGESVQIVGDDAVFPTQVVADDGTGDGTITISQTVTTAAIGLGYTTTIKPTRQEMQMQGGTTLGHKRRWNKIAVRLLDSTGVKINGIQVPFRSSADEMDSGVGLFTGDKIVSNLGWDRDGFIVIEQAQPLPFTLLAITGTLNANDI
jgi:hypothetical protein